MVQRKRIGVFIIVSCSAKLAASIVIKNRVVAYGNNRYQTHPFQLKFGTNDASICLHAEVDVIKNALKRIEVEDLKKATLYVSRAKKRMITQDKWEYVVGLSAPCQGCRRAIATFGIKRVVYTTDDPNKYEIL